MMRKVLLITYLPWATPRMPGLAKYLPEFGWEPIILTPALKAKPETVFSVIETPRRDSMRWLKTLMKISPETDDIRGEVEERLAGKRHSRLLDFLLTRGGEIFNYPDSQKGWLPFGIEAGRRLLKEENFAAMLSSSSPVTAHIIAGELKKNFGTPWVADLRDLWSQNHNYTYSRLRRYFDKRLELKTLAEADGLVTVSLPWAEKLTSLHKGTHTCAITNGFDPDTANLPTAGLTAKFTMTYTGMVYPGKQNPDKLFAALGGLVADGTFNPDDVEVRFYGPESAWLAEESRKYGLSNIIRQYGTVSRQAVAVKQRESQLLLLFDWDDPREKGVYPLKIFEYLAAGRPILATGGVAGNVVSALLDETGAGRHASTVEAAREVLKEMYREFKSRGRLSSHGDASKIAKYSYREMARKFSEILDGLVK